MAADGQLALARGAGSRGRNLGPGSYQLYLELPDQKAEHGADRDDHPLVVFECRPQETCEIDALWQEIHEERLSRSGTTARSLAKKAELRGTVPETARTLWTLSVPELYVLQIWGADSSPDDYERWLGDVLIAVVLESKSI